MSTPTTVSHASNSGQVHWNSSFELEQACEGELMLPEPVGNNESLACAAHAAAQTYNEIVDDSPKSQWRRIIKMLNNLQVFLQPGNLSLDQVVSQLSGMEIGDNLVFLNEVQDAAVVFAKQDRHTVYQSFCTGYTLPSYDDGFYPTCVIRIPDEVFHNQCFQSELANFLFYRMKSPKLLTSILRGVGQVIDVPHIIIKHAYSHHRHGVSKRSLLFLLIKVITRTSFGLGDLGHVSYKVFMLCFMCNLAMDAFEANLSSCLLHAVSCKILRRLGKLGASAPNWLRDNVLKVNTCLRNILEARWMELQAARSPLSSWKPSQLDLDSDSWLSLLGSREYIRSSLTNHDAQSRGFPFTPTYLPRGTLTDFLSLNGAFFERARHIDLYVTLYDVERAVEQEIDDWVARVTDVEQSCAQIKVLMDGYLSHARDAYKGNPDHTSIMLLTGVELWVALDTLVTAAVPVFAECCPGVQRELLDMPLLGKTTSLHRLHRVYQYVSTRYSHFLSRPSSVSGPIKDIFVVQYHNNSPDHHSSLKDFMGEEVVKTHKIVATFELRGPIFLDTWCFATARLLDTFPFGHPKYALPLAELSRLQPCLVKQWTSPITQQIHLICIGPRGHQSSFLQRAFRDVSDHKCIETQPADYFSYPCSEHRYVNDTSHTSNDILAAYSVNLSPHGSIAFGHLRSGGSLQWFNILEQLHSRSLNFRCHDVYFLFAKAALQVGPFDLNIAEWGWHQELQDSSFCYALLAELEGLLEEVSGHLQDVVMMNTIILLLTRLLASSPCEDVSERVIELLRHVRKQMLQCVQELSYDVMMAPMKVKRKNHLRDMAAVCRSTFDVDPKMAHKLFRSAEDTCALLFCAILVRANQPTDTKNMSNYSRLLLERDRRLSLALESISRDVIDTDLSNRGVDLAICSVWYGYRPGPQVWQTLPHPNSHWLSCETKATKCHHSQMVHLNLLDGTLLVNGRTMDGLPHEIMHQSTYSRIFGSRRFLVVPSDIPGMDFCTLAMICEHRVHFTLRDDVLVIQAQYQDKGDILEVIPHEKLQGDLPAGLINGHVHWLNLSTSIIEIRPLEKLWEESPENWRIDCRSGQYRMYKGDEWLVDMRSPTYNMVFNRLKCLDFHENLVITTFPASPCQPSPTRQLFVTLFRYGITFFVNNDGELESRDFKSMVYDENQCIGTLFGLENRLVLRPKVQIEDLIHRCIIIPDGPLSWVEHGHHARVTTCSLGAENVSSHPVTYHTYHVNTDLGCLSSIGSWMSRLYLAHLHAVTSVDWMPDPLTGRTGIQQTFCLLRSAGTKSVTTVLDTRDVKVQTLLSTSSWIYPQLKFAIAEIKYYNLRDGFLRGSESGEPEQPKLPEFGTARTAYLFPFADLGLLQTSSDVARLASSYKSQAEKLAHTISLAVYHWLIQTGRTESRDDRERENTPCLNPDRLPGPLIIQEAEDSWQKHGQFCRSGFDLSPPSIAEVGALLQEATETRQRFRLLFLLPAVILSLKHPDPAFLSILLGLAKQFPLKNPPCYDQCWPLNGFQPSIVALRDCYTNARHSTSQPSDQDIQDKIKQLLDAWPLKTPKAILHYAHMNAELRQLLFRCYYNLEVRKDLTDRLTNFHALWNPAKSSRKVPLRALLALCDDRVKLIKGYIPHLTEVHALPCLIQSSGDTESDLPPPVHSWRIVLDQLLHVRTPPKVPTPSQLEFHFYSARHNMPPVPDSAHTLNKLFTSLRINDTDPRFQEQYITNLHVSERHIPVAPCTLDGVAGELSIEELRQYYLRCRDNFSVALKMLRKELGPSDDPREEALHQSGQWPPITPDSLLQCLASTSSIKLPDGWKKCFISLALLLVQLQRSRRLLWFSLHDLEEEFLSEMENEGCNGWSAEKYPDWILVQVQGNFVIRKIQVDVAFHMISPKFRENTTMQVNMGEGKSSVILPICAASLADGNQLVRVIVPKPLTVQMLRLLADRLGGLVNKPIYHLPFARSFYSTEQVEKLRELLYECMRNHGILVVQPEHVLSLKLTSLEKQLPEGLCGNNLKQSVDRDSATALLQLQKWTHCHARDILDESDDILHPRSQLMYTIGPPKHMQGSPDRWVIVQQVLRLVRRYALSLSRNLPDTIEYELNTSGSFPRIRILRASDARQRLISLIAHDVMNGQLSSFRLQDINHDQQLFAAVRDFIYFKDIDQHKAHIVEEYGRRNGLWDGLLLLRGLLACDILLFALAERRWCVDYGLPPSRTKLAVPYRAKDTPAPKAEFGHPDIRIILTCLSYYYGGLTEEQLKTSFENLQGQDEPAVEYARWLGDFECGSVPEPIKDLKNVNVKSSEQWDKFIFPLFSRNQGAVDFYLSRFVFPKETEEFPWKLAASSWDLAEQRERLVTGFSGTNDTQYLMPTSIRQLQLEHQRGTDARALYYLLQPENNSYMLISHPNGERQTIPELLKMFIDQEPRIRVLLDVGAQMLDLSNHQLAKEWLDLSFDSDGAVYFNDNDEPMVLTKDGACRPLVSSAFSERLDRCVVYLDDAHTRGIDLKFPRDSRAAVTLGPKVTKDRLVQGCMRMRKLGHGHSVMFLAPLEVDRSIRAITHKEDVNIPITTTDVVCWTIHETWTDIQRQAPHWAQQGVNHAYRHDAWLRFCRNKISGKNLAMAWLQPELQSLADLYAPFQPKNARECLPILDKHPKIKQRCIELGVEQLPKARLEEQEREIHREVEREREVDRGVSEANPMKHSLHAAVVYFVKTGDIPSLFVGTVFRPIFTALKGSSAATINARPWSPFVFATSDFCKTVKLVSRQGNMDPYLRPVQWVLSGKWNGHPVLVVLSPFEADRLLPDIRNSEHVHLHLYTPRTLERMRPADDLRFYSIPHLPDDWTPPWDLIDQLNVFAGQLFLRDYESYLRLCRFLGIQHDDPPTNTEAAAGRTMVVPRVLEKMRDMFNNSRLPFVMKLLLIRRRDDSFAKTHMGRILQGERLTEEDFKNTVEEQ